MVMKLGVFTALFSDWPAEKAFDFVSKLGYEMVEIGAGGYVPSTHLPDGKIESILQGKATHYKQTIKKYGLEISALSCHSNHLDPNLKKRKEINDHFKKVIEAASQLDVSIVVTFSGCPFDWGRWYSFPFENIKIYEEGWKEAKEIWMPLLDFSADHDAKIAIEVMPPGIAYNVFTAERLIKEIPHDAFGFNYDPSHYIWQMINPVVPIYKFSKKIFHCHAKDAEICSQWIDESGVLVTGPWRRLGRGWRFRIPGWGNADWRRIISALLEVGYDYVISLEHEDPVMSAEDGAEKNIQFLKPLVIKKPLEVTWFG